MPFRYFSSEYCSLASGATPTWYRAASKSDGRTGAYWAHSRRARFDWPGLLPPANRSWTLLPVMSQDGRSQSKARGGFIFVLVGEHGRQNRFDGRCYRLRAFRVGYLVTLLERLTETIVRSGSFRSRGAPGNRCKRRRQACWQPSFVTRRRSLRGYKGARATARPR